MGWVTLGAIFSTKNSRLIDINAKVWSRFPGSYKTFLSADTVEREDQNGLRYPVEILNSLTGGSSLPNHRLQLKKEFIVMLLRNLCPQKGHVNGARYIVEAHVEQSSALEGCCSVSCRGADTLSQEFYAVLDITQD